MNILPQAIIDRLKARRHLATDAHIADALDEVTVLFVDMEGFTAQAARTSPDVLGKRWMRYSHGSTTSPTVSGWKRSRRLVTPTWRSPARPCPLLDHPAAAADMALALQEALVETRWPSGDPIRARVGIASGPAVAGVIVSASSRMTCGATP
jgi:class 3 adenylate cyclase